MSSGYMQAVLELENWSCRFLLLLQEHTFLPFLLFKGLLIRFHSLVRTVMLEEYSLDTHAFNLRALYLER